MFPTGIPDRFRRSRSRPATPTGIALLGLTLLCGACASGPRQHTLPPPLRLDGVEVEEAWQGALAVLRDRNWTIAHTDRAAGLIVTTRLTAHDPNRWMDCGRAGLFKRDMVHGGTVTLTLRPVGSATVVDVSTAWSVRRRMLDDVVRPEACRSKGTLERSVYEELARTAEGASPPGAAPRTIDP